MYNSSPYLIMQINIYSKGSVFIDALTFLRVEGLRLTNQFLRKIRPLFMTPEIEIIAVVNVENGCI